MSDAVVSRSLVECEEVIERGMQTFVEVGQALAEIRDSRLYLEGYDRFEDYCKERWGWNASRARQICSASEISERIASVTIVTPLCESQVRPLTKLQPAEQPAAWNEAVELAEERGEQVTARVVQEVVDRRTGEVIDDAEIVETKAKPVTKSRPFQHPRRTTVFITLDTDDVEQSAQVIFNETSPAFVRDLANALVRVL